MKQNPNQKCRHCGEFLEIDIDKIFSKESKKDTLCQVCAEYLNDIKFGDIENEISE